SADMPAPVKTSTREASRARARAEANWSVAMHPTVPAIESTVMGLIFRPMTVDDHPSRAAALRDHPAHPLDFRPGRGDAGFVALDGGRPVGVIWAQFVAGPGHVADDIPEMMLHVAEGYRNIGLGA